MKDRSTPLSTLKEIAGRLRFNPNETLYSEEILQAILQARHPLQEIGLEGDTVTRKQVNRALRKLDRAEYMVKVGTTLVGGQLAHSALSEFLDARRLLSPGELSKWEDGVQAVHTG